MTSSLQTRIRIARARPPDPRPRPRRRRRGAQAWPGKTIRIVVPYTPGGSSDIIARAIAQPLSEALKQTVIVENKPGANGNTGTDPVAKAPADGTRCCSATSARWRSRRRSTRSCHSTRRRICAA